MQVHRQERGVPVVAVEDVRREVEQLAAANDRAAEEGVAQQAVVRAVGRRGVDLVALEKVVVRDEDQRHVGPRDRRPQKRRLGHPIRPRDGRGGQELMHGDLVFVEPLPRLPVERHEHDHVVTQRGEGLRQRAGDVAETAGFGDRGDLGGGENDAHD
jgi:hypothetical protein